MTAATAASMPTATISAALHVIRCGDYYDCELYCCDYDCYLYRCDCDCYGDYRLLARYLGKNRQKYQTYSKICKTIKPKQNQAKTHKQHTSKKRCEKLAKTTQKDPSTETSRLYSDCYLYYCRAKCQ